jgi:amino acid transporter
VHPRFRTPPVSILAFVLPVWALAVAGSFRSNVTLSAVARLFTYASTCIALVALRKQRPGGEAFRLPAGPAFAALGVAFSLVLIGRMGRAELLVLVATVAIALVNWFWARHRGKQ